jgi:hypothetical protein
VTGRLSQRIPCGRERCLSGLERFPETINGSWAYSIAPAHPEQHRCIAERSRTSAGQLEECPAPRVHARYLTKSYSAKAHRTVFGLDIGIF